MERDLGDVRFPGAMLTISSGIMFWIFCATLHRRDQRVAEVRGHAPRHHGGLTGWASTSPSSALAILAVALRRR